MARQRPRRGRQHRTRSILIEGCVEVGDITPLEPAEHVVADVRHRKLPPAPQRLSWLQLTRQLLPWLQLACVLIRDCRASLNAPKNLPDEEHAHDAPVLGRVGFLRAAFSPRPRTHACPMCDSTSPLLVDGLEVRLARVVLELSPRSRAARAQAPQLLVHTPTHIRI